MREKGDGAEHDDGDPDGDGPMSSRGLHQKQAPYSFEDVPSCEPDLAGSVVVRCDQRRAWAAASAELLGVCTESARRKKLRKTKRAKVFSKPLSLDYIADRIDTDDPMRGYMG